MYKNESIKYAMEKSLFTHFLHDFWKVHLSTFYMIL